MERKELDAGRGIIIEEKIEKKQEALKIRKKSMPIKILKQNKTNNSNTRPPFCLLLLLLLLLLYPPSHINIFSSTSTYLFSI